MDDNRETHAVSDLWRHVEAKLQSKRSRKPILVRLMPLLRMSHEKQGAEGVSLAIAAVQNEIIGEEPDEDTDN